MYKRLVDMVYLNTKNAQRIPLVLIWGDGTKYRIEHWRQIYARKHTDGRPDWKYWIEIKGKPFVLFYEGPYWTIESSIPPTWEEIRENPWYYEDPSQQDSS